MYIRVEEEGEWFTHTIRETVLCPEKSQIILGVVDWSATDKFLGALSTWKEQGLIRLLKRAFFSLSFEVELRIWYAVQWRERERDRWGGEWKLSRQMATCLRLLLLLSLRTSLLARPAGCLLFVVMLDSSDRKGREKEEREMLGSRLLTRKGDCQAFGERLPTETQVACAERERGFPDFDFDFWAFWAREKWGSN